MVSRDKNKHEPSHLSVQWLICILSPLKPAFCWGSAGVVSITRRLTCITVNSERCRHTSQAARAADLLCREVLMRNMKCYVIEQGLAPTQKRRKKIKKTPVYLFYSLSFALVYLCTPLPPPTHSHHYPPSNPDASLSEWPFAMHSSLPCLASVSGSGPISG